MPNKQWLALDMYQEDPYRPLRMGEHRRIHAQFAPYHKHAACTEARIGSKRPHTTDLPLWVLLSYRVAP